MNNVVQDGNKVQIHPSKHHYQFKTQRTVPKHGVMMVGWGGNNGTTITGGIIANKLGITWQTKSGLQKPNYFGSLTQATTIRVGSSADGKNVHVPFKNIAPMVSPNDLVIGGWDISKMNLADAMHRAEVLEWDLQRQLVPYMKDFVPLPSVYYPDFIAANQEDRADNVLRGSKADNLAQLRRDISEFKAKNGLDSVTVLWTANTERFVELREGMNDTADNLLAAIARGDDEVSPSQVFAVAAIQEGAFSRRGEGKEQLRACGIFFLLLFLFDRVVLCFLRYFILSLISLRPRLVLAFLPVFALRQAAPTSTARRKTR